MGDVGREAQDKGSDLGPFGAVRGLRGGLPEAAGRFQVDKVSVVPCGAEAGQRSSAEVRVSRPRGVRRWPLQDLLDATRLTRGQLSTVVKAGGSTVLVAAEEGLTDWQAESWAERCGWHPWNVWPGMADEAVAAVERCCAASDCSEWFVPGAPHHRFCSEACQARERRRSKKPEKRVCEADDCCVVFALHDVRKRFCSAACRQRHRMSTDPAARRRKNASDRRYYWENVAALREAERRRYWENPDYHRARKRTS